MNLYLILLASLFGSIHCAAMCGGFSVVCSQQKNPLLSQLFYNFGRLFSYQLLSVLAFFLGAQFNLLGISFGVQHLASYLTGIMLILAGAGSLVPKLNLERFYPKFLIFNFFSKILSRLNEIKTKGNLFSLLVGFFTGFLPCGWLYSFLAIAASTKDVGEAQLVMLSFWIGTVPLLFAIGQLSNLVSIPIKRYAPIIISLLMIFFGVYSLFLHVGALITGNQINCH